MMRTYENVGNMNDATFGTSMTLRLLDGNLQFTADPQLSLLNVTGRYHEHDALFSMNLSAAGYLGQFNFRLGYSMPSKEYSREGNLWRRDRSFYYLTAGWGNAHWKARIDIVNPFRADWKGTKATVHTPLHSLALQSYNTSFHRRLNLTFTYTLSYGKKLKHTNELGTATAGQSSIL